MQETLRTLTILGAAIVLSLTSAQPLFASVKPGKPTPNAAENCTSVPLIDSYSVDSAGKKVSAGSSSETARKAVYRMNGEDLVTFVPPAGFDAATASQAELARLHLPPRPAAGPELDLWKRIHAGPEHKWVVPKHLCQTDRTYDIQYTPTHSGLVLDNPSDSHNNWWDSGVIFDEPTFNGVCPSASSYAMWPGFGDDTHLIQAGTDVGPGGDGPNDAYAWYEMIGPNTDNSAMGISPDDLAVNAGDQIWTEVTYEDSLDQVDFDISNLTTGQEYYFNVQNFAGHDAHFYYSGDRIQFIAERATRSVTGEILQLRQPQGNQSKWQNALGNRTVLAYDVGFWTEYFMSSDGKSDGDVLSEPANVTATGSPSISWQDYWYGCS